MSSPRSVTAQLQPAKRPATWQETLQQAKKKHRPKLQDWTRDGFATKRRTEVERLDAVPKCAQRISRVDAGIEPDDFAARFERRSEPCLVENVPEREEWPLNFNARVTNIEHTRTHLISRSSALRHAAGHARRLRSAPVR